MLNVVGLCSKAEYFKCNNGSCVSAKCRCNGNPDCTDFEYKHERTLPRIARDADAKDDAADDADDDDEENPIPEAEEWGDKDKYVDGK